MIIHTVSFRVVLPFVTNILLKEKVGEKETMFQPIFRNGMFLHYSATYKKIRFIFNPSLYRQHILIECEVDNIIGDSNVSENDLKKFEEQFSKIVQEFFINNFIIIIPKFQLFRIDYKYDICFQNDQEIGVFFEIISKAKDRCYNLNKVRPNTEEKTSLYYRPDRKNR